MDILFLGKFRDFHTEKYIKRSFEKLGHTVIPFDYRAWTRRIGIDEMNKKFIDIAIRLKPVLS